MTATVSTLHDIAHVTPIACPACKTGKAALTQRHDGGFDRDGKTEIWVFECDGCGAVSVQPVDK
jgi:hypothetical protein